MQDQSWWCNRGMHKTCEGYGHGNGIPCGCGCHPEEPVVVWDDD